MKALALILLLTLSPAYAAPKWAADAPVRTGNRLVVACHSDGPDETTALLSALNECRSIAASAVSYKFDVETVSVQTETSAQLHEEVSSSSTVSGLECQTLETVQEGNSRWLKCAFDLTKIRSVERLPAKSEASIVSDSREVVVSFVPKCESVIIVGKPGRSLTCSSNPLPVVLKPGDSEIIVRREGFRPKHVPVKLLDTSSVVYLDRN